jgi:hypothetical protein
MIVKRFYTQTTAYDGRYDTQHNNIHCNDTQHIGLICDTQHT